MKKAIIIGCPGSGKTTFGKALSEKTGLPLVHLDRLWHRGDWQTVGIEEFDRQLKAELEKSEWIIDGNFSRTILRRLSCCDTVFYLDLPTHVCLFSAIKRTAQNYGRTREDMGGNCIERFDREKLSFFSSIITFNSKHRKKYHAMLREAEGVEVVVFTSRRQVEEYLKSI